MIHGLVSSIDGSMLASSINEESFQSSKSLGVS